MFDAWVVYAILLVGGIVVGLLLRFLLTLLVVAGLIFVLAVWVLGIVDAGVLSGWVELLGQYFGGISISPELFFTAGTFVFLGGVLVGVLLTSRLRGIERPRPAA